MTRHLKKPQGLRTSKIGITINANGLAWFRRYLEAMLCIAAVMRRECPLWGQKQTLAQVRVMSALPPKADMVQHDCDVRFVPKADIANLIEHLVGAGE